MISCHHIKGLNAQCKLECAKVPTTNTKMLDEEFGDCCQRSSWENIALLTITMDEEKASRLVIASVLIQEWAKSVLVSSD